MNLGMRTFAARPFTPLSLFSASEPGAWYDPSDMSTMYQDAGGRTAVTAVEQPVSLIFDKRASTTFWSGYFDGSGDYLSYASNAAFAVGTGAFTIEAWVYCTSLTQLYQGIISMRVNTASYPGLGLTIDNGQLFFTVADFSAGLKDPANIPLHQWVHVCGVRSGTNAALFVNGVRKASTTSQTQTGIQNDLVIGRYYIGTNDYYFSGYISNARLVKGVAVYDPTQTTITVPTPPLSAVSGTSLLTCQNSTFIDNSPNNFTATVNGNTVTANNIPFGGNHAYTPSTATASRPVLSARYNLLTKTEQFDDAVWTKATATITPDTTVSPTGTTTADTLAVTNSVGQLKIATSPILAAGSYTQELSFRRGNVDWVVFYTSDAGANYAAAWVNTATGALGTVVAAGNFSAVTATVTAQANSFYRIRLNFTKPVTAASDTFVVRPVNGDNSFTATAGNSVIIWGADLRVANDGVSLPVYQRVNTSTDYDTTNFPMYLRFDGSDDYMLTGTITPGTDKAQVFAGARKQTSSTGMLVELSATIASNSGISIDQSQSENSASTGPVGARSYAQWNSTQPITNVLSICADRAGSTAAEEWPVMRQNGVPLSPVYTLNGGSSGNFLAYPLYIGRRGGTTFPYNGRMYGMIVRFGANLDNTQITNTETWLNARTKAY